MEASFTAVTQLGTEAAVLLFFFRTSCASSPPGSAG